MKFAWMLAFVLGIPILGRAGAEVYKVVPPSEVHFLAVTHALGFMPARILGRNQAVSGSVQAEAESGTAQADLEISAQGFQTGIGMRDEHVRELLRYQQYPEILFRLSAIEGFDSTRISGGGLTCTAQGVLTVAGRDKTVDFPIFAVLRGRTLTVQGDVKAKFSDFGIQAPGFGFGVLNQAQDEIVLGANIVAVSEPSGAP